MTEKSVTVSFDISKRDPSFTSSTKDYTISYTHHEPTVKSEGDKELPFLVLLHHFNASREYWQPQIKNPLLAPYHKIAVDAPGFAQSRTSPAGSAWSFDLAAEAILHILDDVSKELGREVKAVSYGDSMGGAHTGLRLGMRDHERVTKEGKERRIVGVVIVGTCAEEESEDFVVDYTQDGEDFATKCRATTSPEQVAQLIDEFATNMGKAGYTESEEPLFAVAREQGTKVIADALKATLVNDDGILEGKQAGETMKMNYRCLNHRRGLIGRLASRPSPLGKTNVLVVHGTDDNAYPFERNYHERTCSAIGTDNSELLVIQGGPHFATASHWETLDKDVVDWIERRCT
ncbi:BQ5605_C004g02673 [Microbotryum silenes-dioicae]|uniref:BQ5605_C004g02652 protein n=1 Tax=Microbotryum silenes-dioicae TaxID=796604 RepID=A0A2X0M8I6_9BASI|nr:BQ5605_C004g02652 [Microbotryum silenes-dioicae]SGY66430.1 BQ5605_C004g02673 [Microbotryum silenes-dioicae]